MENRPVANEFKPEGRTQRREPLQEPDAIEVERDARICTRIHKHGHPVGKRHRAGDILQARIHEIKRNLVGHVALTAPRAAKAQQKEKDDTCNRRHKAAAAPVHIFTRHKASLIFKIYK